MLPSSPIAQKAARMNSSCYYTTFPRGTQEGLPDNRLPGSRRAVLQVRRKSAALFEKMSDHFTNVK